MDFFSFFRRGKPTPVRAAPPRHAPPASPSAADILAGRGGPFFRVERSPDGRSAIIVAVISMRMSHEVEHAVLYELPEERPLAEIGNSLWSADRITWTDEGRGVEFDLRRYPGGAPGVSVAIDIGRSYARIDAGPETPLNELSAALEADYWRRVGSKEGERR
jgi:hypothetical protein